jgi:asparagine synthetase B (glutamine-hydrolysing)
VAGVAASCGRPPVRAYSAVFPRHPTIDESALIELLTCELELSSFALPVLGGSVVSGAVDYMREWEVPATSPNLFFWATLLRQAARDGVTAMLDGEGGDALFWLSPYLLADRLARGGLRSANASVGLHARHPLLDVDLIELVLGLPPELAFDARLSRPLLRESVRGLIPEDVRLRPTKSSFDALFHELLSGGDLAAARSLVLAPDAEVNAFVDPIRVRAELFDKGPSRTAGAL